MSDLVSSRLEGLRAELAELAFTLERSGRLDAADVVLTISARVDELLGDFVDAPVLPRGAS